MTNKEARAYITEWMKDEFALNKNDREALNMAIKALSQEPTVTSTDEPMTMVYPTIFCDDAVSRAELLKAIDTWDKFGYTETGCFVREPKGDYVPYIHYDDVIKCIKGMPSVTQKPIECEDVVSQILKIMWNCRGKHTTSIDKVKMEQIIRDELPSAPQKSGKWIAVYQGDEIINYRCSECELGDTNGSTNLYGWDYCRRCGAKMESEG